MSYMSCPFMDLILYADVYVLCSFFNWDADLFFFLMVDKEYS